MASHTANAIITRTVYKGLLRASARLDALALLPSRAATTVDLTVFKPVMGSVPTVVKDNADATSYVDVVRQVFRSSPVMDMDAAFKALSLANAQAHAIANPSTAADDSATSVAVADDETVDAPTFGVGHVFKHKRFGYRAVIIGVDDSCKASDKWIRATGASRLPNGLEQPFYRVLVDVRDRPEAQVSYVAQDHVDLIMAPESDVDMDMDELQERIVVHPLVTRYFAQYSPAHACFVPQSLTARVVDGGAHPHATGSSSVGGRRTASLY